MPAAKPAKVTLAELRRLAREALGEHSVVLELHDGSRWQVNAYAPDCKIVGRHGAKVTARRQLRDLLQSIITGQNAGEGCTLHGDAPHGKEAEELRSGIEKLIRSGPFRVDIYELQQLLDRVNARDSLAHLRANESRAAFEKRAAPGLDAVMARGRAVVEAQERSRAKGRAPRRRATNGAGRRKT